MTILVVGGGVFVGRAVAEAAAARGHSVFVFNRGRSSSAPPPGVGWIQGDRDRDLGALGGRTWDAVVDACGYFPGQVTSLLSALRGRLGRYVFISTVSAYADLGSPGVSEASALAGDIDPATDKVTPATYGPLKAMCERAAAAAERPPLLVRPGIIAGPRDPTGRLAYWIRRLSKGGRILAPGTPASPLQLIDTRDLGSWIVAMVESGAEGPVNAVGPAEPLTFGGMLEGCAAAAGASPELVWVPDSFIAGQGVTDRTLLPLHIPESFAGFAGLFRTDGRLAFSRGLAPRPIRETITDTHAWLATPEGAASKVLGLAEADEARILEAWGRRAA
jgi:2'-hydroxyisoflavone reductase